VFVCAWCTFEMALSIWELTTGDAHGTGHFTIRGG